MSRDAYNIVAVSPQNRDEFHHIVRTSLFKQSTDDYNQDHQDSLKPDFAAETIDRLLLRFEESAIGAIALQRLKSDPNAAAITHVAVDEKCQGKGHGKALLDLTEAHARKHGIRTLTVNASAEARGFYESCGFKPAVWDHGTLDTWPEYSGPPPTQLLKEI